MPENSADDGSCHKQNRMRNETPGVAFFLIEQPQIVMTWAKETGEMKV